MIDDDDELVVVPTEYQRWQEKLHSICQNTFFLDVMGMFLKDRQFGAPCYDENPQQMAYLCGKESIMRDLTEHIYRADKKAFHRIIDIVKGED